MRWVFHKNQVRPNGIRETFQKEALGIGSESMDFMGFARLTQCCGRSHFYRGTWLLGRQAMTVMTVK